MQRYNMSGVMDDIKEKLEHIKQLEREGIQRRLEEQLGQTRRQISSQATKASQGQQAASRAAGAGRAARPAGAAGQQGQAGQAGEQGEDGRPQPG